MKSDELTHPPPVSLPSLAGDRFLACLRDFALRAGSGQEAAAAAQLTGICLPLARLMALLAA